MINFNHLKNVEESYFAHLYFAIWAGILLTSIGLVSIIHGIFPFLFSRTPDKMFKYFLTHSEKRRTKVDKVLRNKNLE